MSETIRRRSLPDSLRYLADKLDSDTLTDAERAGVIAALRSLADEMGPDAESARPDDGLCTATVDDPRMGLQRCAQSAGHYNGDDQPDMLADDDEPRGWHQSRRDAAGNSTTWADWSIYATPHGGRDEELVDARGHDFQWDGNHSVQRCTRCTLPHPRWAGGPCPGNPLQPGEYV